MWCGSALPSTHVTHPPHEREALRLTRVQPPPHLILPETHLHRRFDFKTGSLRYMLHLGPVAGLPPMPCSAWLAALSPPRRASAPTTTVCAGNSAAWLADAALSRIHLLQQTARGLTWRTAPHTSPSTDSYDLPDRASTSPRILPARHARRNTPPSRNTASPRRLRWRRPGRWRRRRASARCRRARIPPFPSFLPLPLLLVPAAVAFRVSICHL